MLTLGHKIQVADADYIEKLEWDDAMYVQILVVNGDFRPKRN